MNHVAHAPVAPYRIRPARASDAAAILAIYGHGFPDALKQFTALGSPGAAVYLKALLEEGRQGGATPFWVACHVDDDNAVTGFVQWRLAGEVAVLNNIYVDPKCRAARVGTTLLAESLENLHWPCPTIELDVFEHNDRARAWYERLGFAECARQTWYTSASWRPPQASERKPATRPGGDYLIDGLPQADAVHAAFGFSQFQLTTARDTYRIGRLGSEWFRLFSPLVLADGAALTALHRLDAHRRLFLIAGSDKPMEDWPNVALRKVAGSCHMRARREAVIAHLAEQA